MKLAGPVQLIRILLLQEQLAQVGSPRLDFYDFRAHVPVGHVDDLELADEKLVGKELAPEFKNLPDRKVSAAHQEKPDAAHILNQAREPTAPRVQVRSLPDCNTRFGPQFLSSHAHTLRENVGG